MCDMENKEAGKWFEWWYINRYAWELICGEHFTQKQFTMQEALEVLKDLVNREMYQLAIVLLHQLFKSSCMDEVFTHVIVGRLERDSHDMGIISECIAAVEKALIENHAMNNKVML